MFQYPRLEGPGAIVANRSFYRADSVRFLWNKKGTCRCILVQTCTWGVHVHILTYTVLTLIVAKCSGDMLHVVIPVHVHVHVCMRGIKSFNSAFPLSLPSPPPPLFLPLSLSPSLPLPPSLYPSLPPSLPLPHTPLPPPFLSPTPSLPQALPCW